MYSYSKMIEISISLDRENQQLPEASQKILEQLRRKLNIRSPRVKKPTSFIKKYDNEIGEVYKILNKISDKNYERHENSIISILEKTNDDIVKEKVCQKIFEISSSNIFYSKLYTRLVSKLFSLYSNFKKIFEENFEIYYENFKLIKYVSSDENYDEYCNYVKQLDKLKSFTMFMINLVKNDILEPVRILKLFIDLQEKIMENINDKDKLNENEGYIENISLGLKEVITYINNLDDWAWFMDNVKFLANAKGEGKNNKIRFKIMDIEDLIKAKSN